MAHTTILSLFVLLALSLSSHAQTTVDWPNLTSTTLGQVPASAFLTINSTELGSIPPTACQGFTYNQVQNIPATASPGFTSAQIKQMPAYANSGCGGFTGPAMGAMTPAAFSGFTENCIAVLPAPALANWNADQVSNIQAAACNGFTMSNIQGMNASAFAGFSAQQVAQFDAAYSISGCSGILPAQVAAMQPAAFAGWTEDCVSDLLSTAFNTATAEQMSNFPSAAAPGMRYNFVQNIAPAAGAGFSSILLSSMDYQYSTDGCYGLQPALIANIPAASWSGWTEGCVGALIPTAWNMTTADQIAQITKSAANGLDYQTVQNLPPAAGAGWTATALSGVSYQYSTDGCAGFQPAHIATMQPAAFAGWTEGCIGALSSVAFSMINAAQLNQLTPAAAAGFTYLIVKNMSPESGAGWNVNNLAAVSSQYSTDGCGGFQPWHVANILPPVFAAWTADCISILPPTAWNMTTADQISNLTAAAGDGFGYQLVKNLPAAAGAGWNAANLAGVSDQYSTDGCAGFQPWHVAYMQPQAFAGWTADCVSILISTAWNMTNAAQIGYLTAAAADGLSYSLVQNMPGETGAGWTATNLAGVADQYSLDGCAGFTASQVGNMTTNAFTGWTENCVGLLSSTAFSNVNAQQITSFSTTGAAGMSAGLMRNIPPMAAAGWTTTNLPAVSSYYYSDGCGGFTADQIAQIPLSVYPTGWTADCVGLLNATIFLTINLTQMTAFSNSAYTGFEGVQIANIPDPVLTAIPLNKLVALSASGTQGFTPHQLTILIQKYGADFVNLYSVTQLSQYAAYNISNIEQFKALVPNTIAPILTTLPPQPTWLQLVLVNTQVTLDAVTVNNFNWSTVWGITPTQAAAMSDDAIKVLTTGYYPFRLLPDTVGAWSCSQLAVIMPAVNFMMDPTWNVTVTNATKCPNSITSTFGEPTTGGSTWVSNSVSSSSTTGHGISGGEAAGIAVGGVVLVAGITGAAFFLVNRQRQRALYRTIT